MTASWLLELAACPLAAGPFPPEARRCDWCGSGLEGRRRRWCSDGCGQAYSRNHAWTSARAAAIARDRVCVRCGSDGRAPSETWCCVLEVLCPPPAPPRLVDWCRSHGWFPDHVEARDAWRAEARRLERPWQLAHAVLAKDRARHWLEVNHRVPCLGAHSENSCAHHLDGLEVLCHRCHVGETARQRSAGLLRAG